MDVRRRRRREDAGYITVPLEASAAVKAYPRRSSRCNSRNARVYDFKGRKDAARPPSTLAFRASRTPRARYFYFHPDESAGRLADEAHHERRRISLRANRAARPVSTAHPFTRRDFQNWVKPSLDSARLCLSIRAKCKNTIGILSFPSPFSPSISAPG